MGVILGEECFNCCGVDRHEAWMGRQSEKYQDATKVLRKRCNFDPVNAT